MELPCRSPGDILLEPGSLSGIRARLCAIAPRHDLATVIACAFDHRSRMLPFIYADLRMPPAGVRAIGAAMADSGFVKTRIVLQQWNKHFKPSLMRLDGRIPDIFMVSSMQVHWERGREMIRDACRIEPSQRPLVILGGPKAIYEPWDAFSADAGDPWAADVVVTGEEYVLLELLETVLSVRRDGEQLRAAFLRARDQGLLDGIPGLVYARGGADGVAEELVDTGIQRLVGDLDELPFAAQAFRLLEPPGRRATLAGAALPAQQVRRYATIGCLVLTLGCRFSCPYCPIPAYNQRQFRAKSGARVAEEMYGIYRDYGIRYFFGADDNFFNDKGRAVGIMEAIARAEFDGVRLHRKVRWGTEVSVHDILAMREHLKLAREAGIRALWMGVEDMTASLIRKGQSVDRTVEAFGLLRENGICPMPMLMHHDSQPFYTRRGDYGLLNQVRILRGAGATSLQVLMLTPAPGSKSYEGMHESGIVIESAGDRFVGPHMIDGGYVVASRHGKPWRKQLGIMAAYAYFYNPLRLAGVLVRRGNALAYKDAVIQAIGMWGLAHTVRRTLGWMLRLRFRRVTHLAAAPKSTIPMRSPAGGPASHALPGTPRQASHAPAVAPCAEIAPGGATPERGQETASHVSAPRGA